MYQLIIAEKPSVAQSIAAVLGAKRRENGYLEGSGYLVSWCFGHLAELASAETYNEAYSGASFSVMELTDAPAARVMGSAMRLPSESLRISMV